MLVAPHAGFSLKILDPLSKVETTLTSTLPGHYISNEIRVAIVLELHRLVAFNVQMMNGGFKMNLVLQKCSFCANKITNFHIQQHKAVGRARERKRERERERERPK
jgi:hypothetical protein